MDVVLSVRLPSDVQSVPLARGLLRTALQDARVAALLVEDLTLALTEACANVVQHADADADYEVQVEIVGGTCRISVLDHGPGLDGPATASPPGSVLDGGQGLSLMRDRMDAVRSERQPDGRHRVVLEKALAPAVPA